MSVGDDTGWGPDLGWPKKVMVLADDEENVYYRANVLAVDRKRSLVTLEYTQAAGYKNLQFTLPVDHPRLWRYTCDANWWEKLFTDAKWARKRCKHSGGWRPRPGAERFLFSHLHSNEQQKAVAKGAGSQQHSSRGKRHNNSKHPAQQSHHCKGGGSSGSGRSQKLRGLARLATFLGSHTAGCEKHQGITAAARADSKGIGPFSSSSSSSSGTSGGGKSIDARGHSESDSSDTDAGTDTSGELPAAGSDSAPDGCPAAAATADGCGRCSGIAATKDTTGSETVAGSPTLAGVSASNHRRKRRAAADGVVAASLAAAINAGLAGRKKVKYTRQPPAAAAAAAVGEGNCGSHQAAGSGAGHLPPPPAADTAAVGAATRSPLHSVDIRGFKLYIVPVPNSNGSSSTPHFAVSQLAKFAGCDRSVFHDVCRRRTEGVAFATAEQHQLLSQEGAGCWARGRIKLVSAPLAADILEQRGRSAAAQALRAADLSAPTKPPAPPALAAAADAVPPTDSAAAIECDGSMQRSAGAGEVKSSGLSVSTPLANQEVVTPVAGNSTGLQEAVDAAAAAAYPLSKVAEVVPSAAVSLSTVVLDGHELQLVPVVSGGCVRPHILVSQVVRFAQEVAGLRWAVGTACQEAESGVVLATQEQQQLLLTAGVLDVPGNCELVCTALAADVYERYGLKDAAERLRAVDRWALSAALGVEPSAASPLVTAAAHEGSARSLIPVVDMSSEHDEAAAAVAAVAAAQLTQPAVAAVLAVLSTPSRTAEQTDIPAPGASESGTTAGEHQQQHSDSLPASPDGAAQQPVSKEQQPLQGQACGPSAGNQQGAPPPVAVPQPASATAAVEPTPVVPEAVAAQPLQDSGTGGQPLPAQMMTAAAAAGAPLVTPSADTHESAGLGAAQAVPVAVSQDKPRQQHQVLMQLQAADAEAAGKSTHIPDAIMQQQTQQQQQQQPVQETGPASGAAAPALVDLRSGQLSVIAGDGSRWVLLHDLRSFVIHSSEALITTAFEFNCRLNKAAESCSSNIVTQTATPELLQQMMAAGVLAAGSRRAKLLLLEVTATLLKDLGLGDAAVALLNTQPRAAGPVALQQQQPSCAGEPVEPAAVEATQDQPQGRRYLRTGTRQMLDHALEPAAARGARATTIVHTAEVDGSGQPAGPAAHTQQQLVGTQQQPAEQQGWLQRPFAPASGSDHQCLFHRHQSSELIDGVASVGVGVDAQPTICPGRGATAEQVAAGLPTARVSEAVGTAEKVCIDLTDD